ASQLARSLESLGLETLDLYYVHNPEMQLSLGHDAFYARLQAAFGFLEQAVAEGLIRAYGVASWNGFRAAAEGKHTLNEVLACAKAAGGPDHHFRAIQLPLNLAMTEAWLFQNHVYHGKVATVLEVALAENITVFTSGSIQQGQLAKNLPAWVQDAIPDLASDAQRALQFTRSVPGVTTALVGMGRPEHVEENLGLGLRPSLEPRQLQELLGKG
ncbi:MAG: aldo/keto reductase, partial [Candidatus Sericytochromatia bacterium]